MSSKREGWNVKKTHGNISNKGVDVGQSFVHYVLINSTNTKETLR